MSQKRQQEEDAKPPTEDSTSDDKRRKIPSLRNVVLEVMKFHTLKKYIEPVLEPLIRKVVKEEVDLALRKHMYSMKWNSGKEIHPSDSRSLQLQFLDTISLPVFTGSHIEGEDCTTMKVALIDALTGQVVSSGPISSAKVEIVVLEGDFDGNEVNNWTHEEFKSNFVREREGKKSLLTGDAFLNLKEGVGLLGEISFTDNSSWTRSRKFRLGARVVDNCDGIRVREAKTESFIVRDHRGELYKKHHPPSLYDEVWRLEKIGKEGAFHKRLSREKVNTVKDFLTLLFLDPTRLRYLYVNEEMITCLCDLVREVADLIAPMFWQNEYLLFVDYTESILGTGMSSKMWEVTVEHARTCVLDKKIYLFCPRSQEKTGVVFNVVGQLMGLLSDSQYVPTDRLSETEKADANNLVILAFKQWEEVVSFDDESALVDGSSILYNALYPSNSPMVGSSDGIKVLTSDKVCSFDYPQLNASTPDFMPSIYSMECADSMDDYGLHSIESIDVRFDQTLNFPDQVSNSLSTICDTDSITQALCEDEHLQYFDTDCSLQNPSLESQADLHSAVSGFLYARSAAAVAIVKARRRWTILFSVVRWLSIRRIVARKSMLEKHRYIANNPCPNKFQSEMQL